MYCLRVDLGSSCLNQTHRAEMRVPGASGMHTFKALELDSVILYEVLTVYIRLLLF